ncbi:MAG: hypothetical protein JWO80_4482 [Bryobacterales bacterium]|nr:hypothetical protein [Bryobacterales bacterium]
MTSSGLFAAPQEASTDVPRVVSVGVPLRVYLTKRLTKRLGEPVQAKLLEPVYAFDREVIPAGVELIGTVSKLDPVAKMKRASAVLGGDFTPLHQAEVEFTTVIMPDGTRIPVQTTQTVGLNSIYSPPRPSKGKKASNGKPANNTGILGTGKQQIKDQLKSQANSKSRGVIDLVRGPDKMERTEDFLLMKLPYHPQWVRKGTRFDPELREPVRLGTISMKTEDCRLLGSQPPADSVVHARLTTPLDSGTAQLGSKVQAVVTQPLFSAEKKLILPEGTQLSGSVTLVHRARWFHRGGQLRFNFDNIDLSPEIAQLGARAVATKTVATLDGAEASGDATVKVDKEGNVKVVEPKTRLIAPAISVLIASRALDNDAGRNGGHESNTGGRTLGGGSGFGLLGAAAAQSSKYVGSALGIYGMAWSVYLNIIARGGEVEFNNNAAVDIRFSGRPAMTPPPAP